MGPGHHDVQRRGSGRFRLRGADEALRWRDAHRPPYLLFQGGLPADGGEGPLRHRLYLLLERVHGPHHRHHQTAGRQRERPGGHPPRRRAVHPAGGGLGPILLHLPAAAVQAGAPAERGGPPRRPQRRPADLPQARPPEDPHGHQLRGRRGPVQHLQGEPPGRDIGHRLCDAPQRQTLPGETGRGRRPVQPHPERDPQDAHPDAEFTGEYARCGRRT